jgi:hypothetical protein
MDHGLIRRLSTTHPCDDRDARYAMLASRLGAASTLYNLLPIGISYPIQHLFCSDTAGKSMAWPPSLFSGLEGLTDPFRAPPASPPALSGWAYPG